MKTIIFAVTYIGMSISYFLMAKAEEKGTFERKTDFACSALWLLSAAIHFIAWYMDFVK